MLAEITTQNLADCPVCHSSDTELILTHPEAYIDHLMLHECRNCSVTYLSPRLTPESIVFLEEASTVYDFTPAEVEYQVSWRKGIVDQLTQLAKRPGRLLDIGCNRGLLMESARREGWHPVGVELSSVAAERAREAFGLEIYPDLEAVWELEPFDVVVAWHVLEHTLNPVAFLRQAAAMLKPAGILALQVPSFDFRAEWVERNLAGSLLCAVHNFYFTATNIRAVLARAGLTPLWIDNDPQSLLLTAYCTRTVPDVDQPAPIDVSELLEEMAAIQEQASSWYKRAEELDAAVAEKNQHISHLEGMIRHLENGRVMRILQRFAR